MIKPQKHFIICPYPVGVYKTKGDIKWKNYLQVLASQSLLKRINLEILKAHFANCVKHSFESGSEADKDAKISEMVGVLDKLLK